MQVAGRRAWPSTTFIGNGGKKWPDSKNLSLKKKISESRSCASRGWSTCSQQGHRSEWSNTHRKDSLAPEEVCKALISQDIILLFSLLFSVYLSSFGDWAGLNEWKEEGQYYCDITVSFSGDVHGCRFYWQHTGIGKIYDNTRWRCIIFLVISPEIPI